METVDGVMAITTITIIIMDGEMITTEAITMAKTMVGEATSINLSLQSQQMMDGAAISISPNPQNQPMMGGVVILTNLNLKNQLMMVGVAISISQIQTITTMAGEINKTTIIRIIMMDGEITLMEKIMDNRTMDGEMGTTGGENMEMKMVMFYLKYCINSLKSLLTFFTNKISSPIFFT